MGSGTWSATAYTSRSSILKSQNRDEVFTQRKVREDFDPQKISVRESCDSEDHPNSTACILALDVTGSMGMIPEHLIKHSLHDLVGGILDRKPVTDPQIMIMGIGDINFDRAPLQVSQFESDIRIAEQLQDLWLESGGGGNTYESYDLPWAFAARKTKIDCFEKRQQKGYLFTVGDERPPTTISNDIIVERININMGQTELNAADLLAAAQEKYNVFHIIVEEGDYASRNLSSVTREWRELLGKKAISLNNHHHLSEVVISVMEINEGRSVDEVIRSWQDDQIKSVVAHALNLQEQST